jgi:hypothetical protein
MWGGGGRPTPWYEREAYTDRGQQKGKDVEYANGGGSWGQAFVIGCRTLTKREEHMNTYTFIVGLKFSSKQSVCFAFFGLVRGLATVAFIV